MTDTSKRFRQVSMQMYRFLAASIYFYV